MKNTISVYPEKPETCEFYLNRYSYEKPVSLGKWDWSSTFNRWGRFVEFADGWKGFTYPKESTGGIIEKAV